MILLIALATAVVITASHPETVRYLADKFLKEKGIGYSRIEGSLLKGIALYDINYADAVLIKRLKLEYKIPMLFNPTPTLKKIKAEGTLLILENLLENGEDDSQFFIPAFAVSQLYLKETRLLMKEDTLLFDLDAAKIHYSRELNVKRVDLRLATSYGEAHIQGDIRSNRLYAKSSLTPRASLVKKYLGSLQGLEKTLTLDLEAGMQEIVMHTRVEHLNLKEQNASLHNADITLTYLIKEGYFTFDSSYGLSYGELSTKIGHTGVFTAMGVYASQLKATVTRTPFALPFTNLRSEVSGDKEGMIGRLYAGPLEFELEGEGYERFNIHAKSKALPLSFIPNLPALLKQNSIAIRADALLNTAPFSLKGSFDTEGPYSAVEGSFELDKEEQLYLSTLTPKPESTLWKKYPLEQFSPLELVYYNHDKRSILNLDTGMANLTLFKKDTALNGWGNIGSGHFDTYGRIADANDTRLSVTADIPSVHALISEFGFKNPEENLLFDAHADINATVTLTDKVRVKTRVRLPWYILQLDTQRSYQGEDVYLESTLIDQNITIDSYDLNIKDHHVYSQRPSHIAFDTNGSLLLKEFWVYDDLLLSGRLDPVRMEGNLNLRSDRFRYEGKEGNVTLKADIKADFEKNGRQSIEGNITLLDGVITYEPKTDYTISDDIVIIQDIKPHTGFKRFVNLQINSLKPIDYKTQTIDIRLTPDIILRQEPDAPLSIYGMVTLEDGQINGGGKLFELDKSEIYFNGADPVNPYLNLNIRHQVQDDIDILIYITNTLASPLVILTSTPAMSQNDIISYLLFAEPASSAFSSSDEGTGTFALSSLLLATGLKQIFDQSAGVNIDTLNILTNEEGTLGYEIGTRFSKKIRLLYKNDTVSSVILQYKLSRSIRLDVDVHETGQGVSILYVKDF